MEKACCLCTLPTIGSGNLFCFGQPPPQLHWPWPSSSPHTCLHKLILVSGMGPDSGISLVRLLVHRIRPPSSYTIHQFTLSAQDRAPRSPEQPNRPACFFLLLPPPYFFALFFALPSLSFFLLILIFVPSQSSKHIPLRVNSHPFFYSITPFS